MQRVQYGESDLGPPEIITVVFDNDDRELLRQKGEKSVSTRSEHEHEFELELLGNSWPAGTHIWRCGPDERRFDAVS